MSSLTPQQIVKRFDDAALGAPPRVVAAATSLLSAARGRDELDLFMAQVIEALTRLVLTPENQDLAVSASAYDALLQMLERPEILATLQPRDPLAPARLRGLRVQREILAAEGGSCSAQAMADALGISRQAIDKRRKRGVLIGLSLGRRGYAYPVWQIGLPGLADVLSALRGLDPWTQAAYLLAPNRWLDGETPLAVLRRGDVAAVIAAAQTYGEHVAA